MTKPPRHLADLDPPARRAAVAQLGEPPFRGDQLSRHYFARLTDEPDQMTDLPASSRSSLAAELLPRLLTRERELSCDDGMTRKTLWRTFDGARLESVIMRYPDRATACVSSQASSRSAVSSAGSRAPASAAREVRGRSVMSSGCSV